METANGMNGLHLHPSKTSSGVALAISGSKKSKYILKWAMENLIEDEIPQQVCFKLIHIFPVITTVPTPMGNGILISQVRDDIAAAYRKEVKLQTTQKLLPYKMMCLNKKFHVQVLQIESDDIPSAIADVIAKSNINKLVIGISSTSGLFFRGQNLSAKISESCPGFCTVYVVSKANLSSVRPSNQKAISTTGDERSDTGSLSSSPNHTNQVNQNLYNKTTSSCDPRTLSYYVGEREDDGISSSGSSDINYIQSNASSFKSWTTENPATTDHSSSLNVLTDFSMGSQLNINLELEQLRTELRHVHGMYANAQTETLDAFRKLDDLHQQRLEEKIKLKEITAKAKEKLGSCLEGPVDHYLEFSWEEITNATLSFSCDLRVGMGSYGTVYKCTLRHKNAAVKILHSMEANRTKEFQHELEVLSKIRHPNLLTLLGACVDHGCLVYEYMENGNLEERLFRKNQTPPIPWFDRYRIAHEIASALLFLHDSNPKPIIHRDLKPANILLDHNLVSKIGDVGLSTLCKDTSPVGRTICYIDPEYQRSGFISPKSDVYAFGMVILQLLTAKQAMGLTTKMEMAINDDNLDQILDTEAGIWPAKESRELALLALGCTELHHRDRPDLKNQILPALENLRIVAEKVRYFAYPGSSEDPPNHFKCPILKVVMNNPCVAADGYTYERKAIEEWLEKYDTSPVTNMPLLNMTLIQNNALLSAITEWRCRKC